MRTAPANVGEGQLLRVNPVAPPPSAQGASAANGVVGQLQPQTGSSSNPSSITAEHQWAAKPHGAATAEARPRRENILRKLEPGTKAKKAPSPARLAELAKTEWAALYDEVAAADLVDDIEEEPAPARRAPPGAARQDAPATGVGQASTPAGLRALQDALPDALPPTAAANAGVAPQVPTDFRGLEMHVQVEPPRDLATLNDLREADRVIAETDGNKRFTRDKRDLINTETNHLLRDVRETMARPAAGAAQLHADNLADLGLPADRLADRIVDKDSGLVATIIVNKETKTVNIGFGGTGYGRLETEAASPNETPRALKRRNRKLVLSQWVTNVKMILGITPRSFKQGEFITRAVVQRMKSNPDLKNYSLRLTGQSSGATTACYAALMQDKMPRTTLFGDPGLSTRLIRNTNPANWSKAPAMISSYRVEGDMYEWVGRLPGVKRVGTTADLPASPEVDQMYPNRHGNYDLHLDAYIKGVESQPSTEPSSTEPSSTEHPSIEKKRVTSQRIGQKQSDIKGSGVTTAQFTPGFKNISGNHCFANAGLKQMITGLTLDDVKVLRNNAWTLGKAKDPAETANLAREKAVAEGVRENQIENAVVTAEPYSPGKATVTRAFAELAEAVLLARQQESNGQDVARKHAAFFDTLKAFGQSGEHGAQTFGELFPEKGGQPQQDPEEMLTTLSDFMGLNALYKKFEFVKNTTSLDGTQTRFKSDETNAYLSMAVSGQTLPQCFEDSVEVMDGDNAILWDDGIKRDANTKESYGFHDPDTLQRVRIQAKVFAWDGISKASRKVQEGRELLAGLGPVIPLPILNTTTNERKPQPFQVQSIVVHMGGRTAQSGHYVTLEQQNGKWFLHNDSEVKQLKGDMQDYFAKNKNAVPYLISLQRVAPTVAE